MNELKNRGVEDIRICSVDGFNGFLQVILTVYPQKIVHQIYNSTRYVSDKDMKEFMRDAKGISSIYP